MRIVVNDKRTKDLELVYTENLWTGRRRLSYNGKEAEKKSRSRFLLHLENGDIEFCIKGNVFLGIAVQSPVFREPVRIRRGFSPFEWIFSILAVVLGIACGILGGWTGGVIGGALQGCAFGAIGGLFYALTVIAVVCIEKKWLRYLVCAELVLVSAGLAFFAGYGFALLRLAAM